MDTPSNNLPAPDHAALLASLPHQAPFRFVEAIVSIDAGHIRTKLFANPQFDFFSGHYPGNPIMPGVLLCEAAFQAAAIYINYTLPQTQEDYNADTPGTPVLSKIEDARFKQIVRPGDNLEIEVKPREILSGFHFMSATVFKDGKRAVQLKFALTIA